jgi:hypothetical protein
MMMKKPTIPELVEMKRALVEDRLNNYLETEAGCWEYQGYLGHYNYGTLNVGFNYKRFSYLLHRVAYYYHTKNDPASLLVRHQCDNPRCINPKHLLLGNHKDNTSDAISRGRLPRGEKHYNSFLTPNDVLNIRQRLLGAETQQEIADSFGVSNSTVSDIHKGKRWSHIQLPSETRTKELQNPHQLTLTL